MDLALKYLLAAVLALGAPKHPPPKLSTPYLRQIATEAAYRHSLPPSLVHRLIKIESGWNPSAFKYEARLKAGSIGLTQIFSSTAKIPKHELFKPEVNLNAGCKELARCIKLGGSIRRGLVCYNGGPGCLKYRCPAAEKYASLFITVSPNPPVTPDCAPPS